MTKYLGDEPEEEIMLDYNLEDNNDNDIPEIRPMDLTLKEVLKYETEKAYKSRWDTLYHNLRGKGYSHEDATEIVDRDVIPFRGGEEDEKHGDR